MLKHFTHSADDLEAERLPEVHRAVTLIHE
jgi:hypothetical protein